MGLPGSNGLEHVDTEKLNKVYGVDINQEYLVDSSGGDGSLNPNSTYNDWKWILVRTNGGQWQHVDHGY